MIMACRFLFLLALQLVHGEKVHRVFPAAQVETYNTDSTLAGVVYPSQLCITISGPKGIRKVLDPAVQRFQKSLEGVPDFADSYEENPHNLTLLEIQRLAIHVELPDLQPYHDIPEDYEVSVEELDRSLASIKAQTVFGAMYGLETLAQLLEFGWMNARKTEEAVFLIRGLPLHIQDHPAYSFRGLMIDTGRHYLPIELILRNLDAMAMNKMNVLHWHLTDRESFPYQTRSLPEVANKGAFHPQRIYTTKDIETVIQEAALRGIRVIPEVDLPGHTTVIRKSYPGLMSHCPLPSEPVDPTNPDVFKFVETIYDDLKDLFPDEYVHLGGDEVNFDCWNNSKTISAWMEEHNMSSTVELYEYFETRLLRIVDNVQKTPIVWQEVFNLNLTISENTIVDVWKGFDRKTIEQATNQSFRVVLSGCWYLDHLGDNWEKYYECNPRDFNGTHDLMIGGHASMWGETVDASNFMSRVWPRASAAAERLWKGNVSDGAQKSSKERIRSFRCRMVQQGFSAAPIAPGFCPHEVPFQDETMVTFAESEIFPAVNGKVLRGG